MDIKEFEHLEKLFGKGIGQWYVGMGNSVSAGFKDLLWHLDRHGQILIEVVGVFDYEYYDQLSYFILFKSCDNLEYLEFKYQKQVDNNLSR
jgi:hypothetical protein